MNINLHLPILLVVFNLGTAFLVPLLYYFKPKNGPILVMISSFISLISSILILRYVRIYGSFTYLLGNWDKMVGIELTIDYLTVIMLVLIDLISFLIIWYTLAEIKLELKTPKVGWYLTLIILLKASLMGMVMSNDLFNIFVFVEVSLISSTAIIAIKGTPKALKASFKYLMLNVIASACILLAIGMTYMITGQLNLDLIHEKLMVTAFQYQRVFLTSLSLFTIGFGLKAALFPLHIWLPDAHSTAPTPSSALLSGLVVKGYIVVIIRIFYQMVSIELLEKTPMLTLLGWLSGAAIIIGSIFALTQIDIKRLLAYSSIVQVGYIFLGISLATPAALTGALLHIINHAFMKTTLFLSAGLIIFKTGKRSRDTLVGIGGETPYSMAAFTVASLAMVGIPPLNGFFSKWFLAMGSLEANKPIFVFVILLSSLLNGAYYLPVIIRAFFPLKEVHHTLEPERIKVDKLLILPVLLLALGNLITGLGIDKIMIYVENAVETLL
ncbi:MAG: hypothetical protein KAX49_04960 [Halanaerobiales bacterium]|nr:hypothetical protein [Halanaerobiales bacterium]